MNQRRIPQWTKACRLGSLLLMLALSPALASAEWRASTQAEQTLDAAAFKGVDQHINEQLSDVQSTVVVLRGRVVYAYYRDGAPNALRDVQSVAKSAISAVVGMAVGQGRIASLDLPVVTLMPEWATLNRDPRAAAITVRHLLTMTAGFQVNDPTGTAAAGRAQEMWARPLRSAPGEAFAYDNALVPMLVAVLEKATAMPLADYVRNMLVEPLAMQEPTYRRGLQMRTEDMAKLGQLFLQKGKWDDKEIIPESYVMAASEPQNAGGSPAFMPYGYMWWIIPSKAQRQTFMASGYSGQLIWVYPPLDLVIATTSTVSAESQRRGQAVQLVRGQLFNAVNKRAAGGPDAENPSREK